MTNEKQSVTGQQVKKIYAKCKELDVPLPMEYNKLLDLSIQEASNIIDQLEQQKPKQVELELVEKKQQFSDVGFGLAVKLVEQYLINLNQFHKGTSEEYCQLVEKVYKRHQQAKKYLKSKLI